MPSDVVGRVLENQSLGGGYFLTTLEAPTIAGVCEPGQFVMAGSLDPSELLLRRPFSVCLVGPGPGGDRSSVAVLYRVVGRGTSFLSRLAPGDEAALLGPLGHGFSMPREGETPVVVAGGVGIAAFPFFLERLAASGRPAHLLYGGRTKLDLPMLEWLRERALSVAVTTDDGSSGARGLVTAALEARLAGPASRRDRLYLCGPHAMMKAVAAIAARAGVACEVALETPMACGYGVCVGCVVEVHDFQGEYGRYRRVCVDGPVMDAGEIRW
jgi:dihydroorotate dehydrogenase electron transfer subunit